MVLVYGWTLTSHGRRLSDGAVTRYGQAVSAIALLITSISIAQGRTGGGRGDVVLHEPLPSSDGKGLVPVFVYDPRDTSELPRKIHIGDEVLPAPSARPSGGQTYEAPNAHQRPLSLGAEPRGSLGSAAKPDRQTQKESALNYQASFDPSVVPFKRNRALNTCLLYTSDAADE